METMGQNPIENSINVGHFGLTLFVKFGEITGRGNYKFVGNVDFCGGSF